MNVFIAAAFPNRFRLREEVVPVINAMGHGVTSQWIWADDDSGDPAVHARNNIDDMRSAQLLILDTLHTEGSHGGADVELGYILGLGHHEVWLVGPPTNIYTHMPRIRRFWDWAATLEALRAR